MRMKTNRWVPAALLATACGCLATAQAQFTLIARGTLTGSSAGSYADLSGLTDTLENGVPHNLLGGFGSGISQLSGDTFVAVPDRGPNGVSYNPLVDDTDSYINRFHTIKMNLAENTSGAGLPFTITPELQATTLLHALLPLSYGTGQGLISAAVCRLRTTTSSTTLPGALTASIPTPAPATHSTPGSTPRACAFRTTG